MLITFKCWLERISWSNRSRARDLRAALAKQHNTAQAEFNRAAALVGHRDPLRSIRRDLCFSGRPEPQVNPDRNSVQSPLLAHQRECLHARARQRRERRDEAGPWLLQLRTAW